MFKKTLVLLLLALSTGCATSGASNKLPSLESSGALPPNIGIMLVSTGRAKSGWGKQLPFVSYGIYQESGDSTLQKVSFLPAEAGLVSQLGEGKFGFVHIRELQAGKYYLVGQKGRGNALDSPFGILAILPSGLLHYDTDGKKVDVSFEFDIEAGKVIYMGEILVISELSDGDAIQLSDQSERDYVAIKDKFPALNSLQFVKVQPRRLESDTAMD